MLQFDVKRLFRSVSHIFTLRGRVERGTIALQTFILTERYPSEFSADEIYDIVDTALFRSIKESCVKGHGDYTGMEDEQWIKQLKWKLEYLMEKEKVFKIIDEMLNGKISKDEMLGILSARRYEEPWGI